MARSNDLEQFGRQGDAAYDKYVKPNVSEADLGKFVAINVDTGEYVIADDDLTAVHKLGAPAVSVWLTRVGSRFAAHLLSRRAVD